jgi:hypothetical protein
LVVQAALFAGFLSAFLIELLGRLEQDPLDIIQDVLIYQTQMMRNSSLGPYVPADFSPPEHIVVVNALFYPSLGVMILAAFIAMLIKSWVREFDRGLRAMSLPEQRAKTREFRYLGMEHWKLPEMVGILPSLIQISLLLFAIGLVIFLFHISKPSCGVTTTIFGIGILYYAMATSISVVVSSSPFHSPLSRRLGKVYQRLHAYFCPDFRFFLGIAMDTTPATTLGRFRRHIQIFLQKSRPYLENDFEEPISATTLDEVQLSTAASALQRIHESAPNSQHSEALQWSVWQVAGSTTLRVPPLFNLPSWVRSNWDGKEHFSHLPPAMLVALTAVSLRTRTKLGWLHTVSMNDVLERMGDSRSSWAQLVMAVFDRYKRSLYWSWSAPKTMIRTKHDSLTRAVQRKDMRIEESLWLLRTLSELCSEGHLSREGPYLIVICLDMLLNHLGGGYSTSSDVFLLEAAVTFAAILCSPDRGNRRNIITSSREYPWFLLNIRNPALFGNWFEDIPSDSHMSLISLLLLVVHVLINRGSYSLAAQYFDIITARGDFSLYTSALISITRATRDDILATIVRVLVASQTPINDGSVSRGRLFARSYAQEELLSSYDHYLGASGNPDPNFFAILLVLSQHQSEYEPSLQNLNLKLKNPWLRQVAAPLDIPDGSGLPLELWSDHRVFNMIAAFSLMRYTEGRVTQHTESLLLASFLQSRELSISSVALEHYMKAAVSYSGTSAPSSYLSHGVHAAFNLMLPDNQLRMGWRILETYVNGFDDLPVEWRRTFAEGFFHRSRQPQPRSQGDTETNSPERELKDILTWEYFHEEEQESEFTDSEFSGLDWLVIAWSLHLSEQYGRMIEGSEQRETESQDMSSPAVNGGFVLRSLCKLLDAAPYYQVIPIIPKLCELVQWFDDTDLHEYRHTISTWIKKAVRRHEEFQVLHKFNKFHCMWHI